VSQPYIGEIRLAGFNFAPASWAFASGQLMAISQNATLYNLIGTTYGGDGVNTFALPNIQGRMPMHMGTGTGLSQRLQSQLGGAESTTFAAAQIPSAPQAPISALAPAGPALASVSPFLVVSFIISLFGIYPSQT
jgi:microcystin-dependent protein